MTTQRSFRAAIVGASGYGGGELIRRLLAHPHVELTRVAAIDHVGEPVWAAHPHLEGATDLRFEDLAPSDAARGMDVVLLAVPPRVSAKLLPDLLAEGALVVDMSGDFRLKDTAAYRRYYGGEHPAPHLMPGFVYAQPEQNREALRTARKAAAPGCFATAIELALLPLARAGWLFGSVEVVGITGSSGAGVTPTPTTHHPVRAVNLRTYKPLEHPHVPEVLESLAAQGARDLALHFVPVSAPLTRGIFVTAFAHVPAAVTPDDLAAAFARTVANEPFLRFPQRRLPEVAAVAGSNCCELGFTASSDVDPVTGRRAVTCFAALDNLIKGGAGQVIQAMNLMLGLDETLTLRDPGGYP